MAENIKIRIGNRIRELRKEKGISQEKLAGLAEIDRTYMTSVENGRRNIAVVNLEKIVNALGVDLKEFFNNNDFGK